MDAAVVSGRPDQSVYSLLYTDEEYDEYLASQTPMVSSDSPVLGWAEHQTEDSHRVLVDALDLVDLSQQSVSSSAGAPIPSTSQTTSTLPELPSLSSNSLIMLPPLGLGHSSTASPTTPPPTTYSTMRVRKKTSNKKFPAIPSTILADQQPGISLPDPNLFPDPYPYPRMGLSTTPHSSDGSSASARSSAYTSPGSTALRSSVTSMSDYTHSEKNSSNHHSSDHPTSPDGATDDTVQVSLPQALTDSPDSQSRWSSSHEEKAISRPRSDSWTHYAPGLASTKPHSSYEWQTVEAPPEIEVTTDEDESYGDEEDYHQPEEMQRTAAITVAEEGRGLIIEGAGLPVSQLTVQPGTTHLLLTSSETPNQIPTFLSYVLPPICTSLLALDISCNFLVSLPPALAQCVVLEELNIASNPLRALPIWLANLVCLRVLIADSTGCASLPSSLASLHFLHTLGLRRNRLYSLPAWLCLLPNLESLLVDGNPFQGPWKALLDPLSPKTFPQSPMYPPNTPHTAVSLASESDYSEPPSARSIDHPRDLQQVNQNDEDYAVTHTATSPQHSPFPRNSSRSNPPSRPGSSRGATTQPRSPGLNRTRTAPSTRHKPGTSALSQTLGALYPVTNQRSSSEEELGYEPEDQIIGQALASPMVPLQAGARESMYSIAGSDGSIKSPRKMRSADELRRMGPMSSVNPYPSTRGAVPRPTRELIPATSQNDSRFLSLGRSALESRTLVTSVFTPPNRLNLTDFSRPQSTSAQFTTAAKTSPPPLPTVRPYGGRDTLVAELRDKDNKEKGKWGFLKKMSMNRIKSTGSVPTASNLRPTTAQSAYLSTGFHSTLSASTIVDTTSAPSLSISIDTSGLAGHSPNSTSPRPQFKPSDSNLMLPVAAPTHGQSLMVPASPNERRSAKRRSFLPIDAAPSLSIPIPALTTRTIALGPEGDEGEHHRRNQADLDEAAAHEALIEDKQRETHSRALRSVMAYLRDMSDLGAGSAAVAPFANTPVFSYANNTNHFASAPDLTSAAPGSSKPGSRRPTLGNADRTPTDPYSSSVSATSSSTYSGAPSSTVNRPLRSMSSSTSLRGPTMSVTTSDSRESTGSGGADERKIKDDKVKRAMIVKEIVSTERTYVKGLQELVDIYVKSACAPVIVLGNVSNKETIVPAPERKIVFNGLDSLLSFHRESFLPALEKAVAPLDHSEDIDGETSASVAKAVAGVFLSHAAFMKMYSTYINNFDNAVQRIKFWTGSSPLPPSNPPPTVPSASGAISAIGRNMAALNSGSIEPNPNHTQAILSSSQKKRIKGYLKRCRLNPRHSQLNLEGYLLLPIQRIPRYRLLLEELVRSTPPRPDALDDPLESALSEIASLANNMNEGKRDSESRRKLVQWQSRIRGKFPSPLVQPHRRLIMDGRLHLTRVVRKTSNFFEVVNFDGDKALVSVECLAPEITPRSLVAILCNDLLVLCKDPSNGKDANGHVDLWAVLRMQTIPQPASIVHGNALRLVDNKAVLYFDALSTSEALTWCRAINMHIPASK